MQANQFSFDQKSQPTDKVIYEDRKSNCKLQIWDQASSLEVETTNGLFYRDIAAALVCFSLTDKQTFLNTKKWSEIIDQQCGNDKNIIKFLVGLKEDAVEDQCISQAEIFDVVGENKFNLYQPVSAQTGNNIDKLFSGLTKLIKTDKDLIKISKSHGSFYMSLKQN